MKYLVLLFLASALIGCGKGSTAGTASTTPNQPAPSPTPATHIYTMQVTGDGTSFALSMSVNWTDADVQTVATGTVLIAAGQTLTYSLTGRYLRQTQLNRVSAPGATLFGKLYRDGILVEQDAGGLNVGGTWWLYADRD